MESEDVNKMSRRNKLLDSQFKMIEVTGKISGDVKDILYLENKDERLKRIVEKYNTRDKLLFTSEVVDDFVNNLSDELLKIFGDIEEDKSSFKEMGISYEEKAFYDILVIVRDEHGFIFENEKCIELAKKISEKLNLIKGQN